MTTSRRGRGGASVFLSPAARAILIGRARRAAAVVRQGRQTTTRAAAAELSDDEDAPDFGRRFGEVALDAASRAIAVRSAEIS